MRAHARWWVIGFLLLAVVAIAPRAARAQDDRTETLRRATSNMLMGPLDVVLSPAVTVRALYDGSKASNESVPAMLATELFGGAGFYFPVTAAAGFFRTWSGVIEMPIGLVLLGTKSFTKWQPPALFTVGDEPAMVNHPDSAIPVKFGVQYLGGG